LIVVYDSRNTLFILSFPLCTILPYRLSHEVFSSAVLCFFFRNIRIVFLLTVNRLNDARVLSITTTWLYYPGAPDWGCSVLMYPSNDGFTKK